MRGPAGEQFAQYAGRCAFSDGDATGDADDEGHFRFAAVEKLGRRRMQKLRCTHIIVHELRDGQVNVGYFVLRDALDQSGKSHQVFISQRKLDTIPKLRPLPA